MSDEFNPNAFEEYLESIPPRASRKAPGNFDAYEFGEPPRIENWQIVNVNDFCEVLYGNIYSHPLLGDVPMGRTSWLIWISTKEGFARTRSRIYRLGVRAKRSRLTIESLDEI
jgi:hypothetical protein